MGLRTQILVVGRNPTLLHIRSLILGTYFEVELAGRLSEAAARLSQQQFGLIVLCDTLSDFECRQIAAYAQQCQPRPSLLLLLGPGARSREGLPVCRSARSERPLDLLKECASVLKLHIPGKQRFTRHA